MDKGQVLNERYGIERCLGRGGSGAVYLAHRLDTGARVAIKESLLHGSDSTVLSRAMRQLKFEAQLLSQLEHAALPRVQDFFTIGDWRYYLVMDFVEGETLQQRVQRQGPQPTQSVLRWGRVLCEVLSYLHDRTPQVILRDLKPGNIMLDVFENLKVIDFGVSKVLESTHDPRFPPATPQGDPQLTGTWARGAGTPGYAPIEQYNNAGTDVRTDIYALGATLYHLLTGAPPPPSPVLGAGLKTIAPLPSIRCDVPPALSDTIHFMLQVRASERPQSIDHVIHLLSPEGLGEADGGALPTFAMLPSRRALTGVTASAEPTRDDPVADLPPSGNQNDGGTTGGPIRQRETATPVAGEHESTLSLGQVARKRSWTKAPRLLAVAAALGVAGVWGLATNHPGVDTQSVLVSGTPEAQVAVDGRPTHPVGPTPSPVSMEPGHHLLRVYRAGYHDTWGGVSVKAGDLFPLEVHYALVPSEAKETPLVQPRAGAGDVPVAAQCNIFGAGRRAPDAPGGGGAGLVPVGIALPPGENRVVLFDTVSGQVSYRAGGAWTSGEGEPEAAPDRVGYRSFGGLAGYQDLGPEARRFVLVGVFVDDWTPTDPAPVPLQIRSLPLDLHPDLRQVFPIGTGLSTTGEPRRFFVPEAATRLFLGFDKGHDDQVGGYDSNVGSLHVHYRLEDESHPPSR